MSRSYRESSWFWRWFWSHLDLAPHLDNVTDPERYLNETQDILRTNHFDWRFALVASLGFLASSYSLFATSIIWPALRFVYQEDMASSGILIDPGVAFDLVTLGSIIVGMILFGHLADRYGRKRLYGLELVIIVIATLGITFSSSGFMVLTSSSSSNNDETGSSYRSTMNIFKSVTAWRFFLGLGIGAEYPMSAIIAAECLSTEWRGTITAIVFSMQSLARLMAFGFANAFLIHQENAIIVDKSNPTMDERKLVIDSVWRFVAGLGGVFAAIAIVLRLTMPESPRYVPGIENQLSDALSPIHEIEDTDGSINRTSQHATREAGISHEQSGKTEYESRWLLGAWRYLQVDGNLKKFATISTLWFLLDVCFYGIGLDSPNTLEILDPSHCPPRHSDIFCDLHNDDVHSLEVSSISATVGSLLMIILINYFPRKMLLFWTSLILAIIFIITGTLVLMQSKMSNYYGSLVFFALAQFVFNIGPNTIIFVLVAEIFPTVFRGTFYGLTAACGKVGALLIRGFLQMATDNISTTRPFSAMLFVFGAVMLAVAGLSRIDFFASSIPEVQKEHDPSRQRWYMKLENKNLEAIAPNPPAGRLSKVSAKPIRQQILDQIRLDDLPTRNGSHQPVM